jgi:acetyltransferase-like isoleucine patch superfamily enzyme
MRIQAWLRVRLLDERGMALVMAVGIAAVLLIAGATAIAASTSAAKESVQSRSRQSAFSMAESGINNSMAVLNLPTNNALDQDTLPPCTSNQTKYSDPTAQRTATSTWRHSTFPDGSTVDYCATLVRSQAWWYLTSIGRTRNPNLASGTVNRTLEATVTVTPTITQPLNNPVWNYLYAGHTGSTCDQSLPNNITGSSRMYVAGNLCISQNVGLAQSSVIVGGNVDIGNNASIGASTNLSTRVETAIGGNCRYTNSGSWTACTGNQDANHIYSKLSDGTTIGVNHTPPVVAPPAADYATWYENAIPGPSQTCTTSSGTPPTFDGNYPSRDGSVSTIFDLTPSSSYFCRVGPGANTTLANAITATQTTITVAAGTTGFPSSQFNIRIDDEYMTVTGGFGTTTWTVVRGAKASTAAAHVSSQTVEWDTAPSGEIAWNAATKTLSVSGTLYIDGSAKIGNGSINTYNGQGTLYLSGTLRITGKFCASVSGSDCNFASWNPNFDMFMVVANGNGGQINPGDSIEMDNNYTWQGGLYGTNAVEFGNNDAVDGPIVGSSIILSNNLATNAFPTISIVPVGMPSNKDVYAQPNPPQGFTG